METLTYKQQAKKFLKDTKTNISIIFLRKGLHFEGDTEQRNIYNVTLLNDKHTYSFNFGDSIHNTEKGIKPTIYDVLSCLNIDYSEDFKDFCENYGYDACDEDNWDGNFINESVLRIYRSVKKETESLKKLFTEDELEMLHEIQ